jgi:hypothetical protein
LHEATPPPPDDESHDPPQFHDPKATKTARLEAAADGRQMNPNRLRIPSGEKGFGKYRRVEHK